MTRRLLDEYGLQSACSMGLPADADVSSEDPSVLAKGKKLLDRAVEVTQELGADDLCGVLYSQLGKYPAPVTATVARARGRRDPALAARGRRRPR